MSGELANSYTDNRRLQIGKKYHVLVDWGFGEVEFTAVFVGFPVTLSDGSPDYYYTSWDNGVRVNK
jgi:hypothetical protein